RVVIPRYEPTRSGKVVLEPPQQRERHDLNGHHSGQRPAKAGVRFFAHGTGAGERAARWSAESRFTKSRAAPALPAGSCRKNARGPTTTVVKRERSVWAIVAGSSTVTGSPSCWSMGATLSPTPGMYARRSELAYDTSTASMRIVAGRYCLCGRMCSYSIGM